MNQEPRTPAMLEGQETLFDEKVGLSPVKVVEVDEVRSGGRRGPRGRS